MAPDEPEPLSVEDLDRIKTAANTCLKVLHVLASVVERLPRGALPSYSLPVVADELRDALDRLQPPPALWKALGREEAEVIPAGPFIIGREVSAFRVLCTTSGWVLKLLAPAGRKSEEQAKELGPLHFAAEQIELWKGVRDGYAAMGLTVKSVADLAAALENEFELVARQVRREPPPPGLSDTQYDILAAMLALGAVGPDAKQTREVIGKKALGPGFKERTVNDAVAGLSDVKCGLVETRQGRTGGCWLTPEGERVAKALKR